MPYFEFVCNDCGVYFECITERKDKRKTFCPDCKSKELSMVGFAKEIPTRVETLQNTLIRLENRVNALVEAIGLEENEDKPSRKNNFTYKI